MQSRELGFMSSWRMLTRDKGWVKPLLVLTLVSWIPILGQIAVLGYGLEWARLTAWGVDSAPKQRDVDYGKVLVTGGRAFLIVISLGFACGLVLQVLFPGSLAIIMSSAAGGGALASSLAVASGATVSILTLVATAFMGTFLQAAAMRGTLYDSFSAGWRLDRLAQMIGRDFGGFCRVLLVTVIGSFISGVYAFVVAMIAVLIVMGGLLSATAVIGLSDPYMNGWHCLADQLLRMGAGPLLLFVLLVIAFAFVGNVIATAMSLVSANAMGQWFCRFDVNRWGVSAAPLPDDVPHRDSRAPQPASAPVDPTSTPAAATSASVDVTAASAAATGAPATATVVSADVTPLDADPEPAVPAVEPLDADVPSADSAVEPLDADAPTTAVGDDEAAADNAGDEAGPDAADECAVPEKTPIPLGPITSDDEVEDEDQGPIAE